MRILFDISHPAHVHLFRNAIIELRDAGDRVHVISRKKDLTTDLLDAYNIPHTPISAKGDSKMSLAGEWLARESRTIIEARSFNPDVVVSRLNPPAAHAARLVGARSIVFDDSEKAIFPAHITHPFADIICTPEKFNRDLGPKQKRYRGFHELAYLHPNQFTPDPGSLRNYGIDPDEHFAVIRFVSWGAHHDVSQRGLSIDAKRQIVDRLTAEGSVYITSESQLPKEFEEHRLPIPPELIHQLLYHANIYVGDSQTMAAEAAVLGTPAVRSNTFAGEDDMSNFVTLESEYGLLHSTADEQEAIDLVNSLLSTPNLKQKWDQNRRDLINDKIDVTRYLIDLVRNQSQNETISPLLESMGKPHDMSGQTKQYNKHKIKDEYEEFYKSRDFTKFPVADTHFIQALVEEFGIDSGMRVLDVACGTGKYSKRLSDCGADVTGLDISQNAVDIARNKYADVNFVVGDALNPPFEENFFEVIFCHGFSLFNEPDLEATRCYMKTSANHLKEGGIFIFGKTSTLSDEISGGNSRMDHSLETFRRFFESLDDFQIKGAYATAPHVFIPLGRFGFSDIVTILSKGAASLLDLPLRVYIVLEKIQIEQ